MIDDLPRLTVVEVGRPEARRFIIIDQFDRCWNGRHFDRHRSKARLYGCRNDATEVALDFVRQHYDDRPKTTYVVPVVVEVWSDRLEPVAAVIDWCSQAASLSLDSRRFGNGPSRSLVLPKIKWSAMRKESLHERRP